MPSLRKPTASSASEVNGTGSNNLYIEKFLIEPKEKQGILKSKKDSLTTTKPMEILTPSKRRDEWTLMLFLCALVTTVGACIPIGYSIGVLNTPQAIIRDFCNSTFQDRYGMPINTSGMNILWSVIVSILLVSGMAGSLSCSWMADKYGRKGTLFYCLALETVAAVLLTSSRWAHSFEMLLVARFLLGFAAGLVTGISPLYLTEIAPLGLRGLMGVLCPMGLSTGVFIAQILGFSFILGNESTWHYLVGLYVILTVPSMLLLHHLPESPKYLYVTKGLNEKGIEELIRLRNVGRDELKEDLEELCIEGIHQEENKIGSQFGVASVIKSPQQRLPLLLVIVLNLGQQLSGINAVFYYSMTIFEQAGLGKSGSQFASVCAGGVNLTMAFLALKLVGCFTRRALIMTSCALASVFLILLIFVILFIESFWWMPYFSIFAVLIYVFSFGIGLGPIPFFIGSELFEIGPRPAAMSLGCMANWSGNLAVGMAFPIMQQFLGPWAFAPFAIVCAAVGIFINIHLPETKGLDPVQVSLLFSEPRCLRCQQLLPSDSDGEAAIGPKMTVSTVLEDESINKS